MEGARFDSGPLALAFALAGNAILTFVSMKTGTRFTYRIRLKEMDDGKKLRFVSVLSSPSEYTFLGTVFEDGTYRHGRRSSVGADAPSAIAFAWSWRWLSSSRLPPNAEVWHEGTCGRCGRPLTVPESIAAGIGPVCAGKE